MKTVSVLSVTNNPDIVQQSQLDPYSSSDCQFKVAYTPTELREITSQEEANIVLPLALDQLKAVVYEQHGPRIQLVDPIAVSLEFIKTII
ncbi:MAG: hypothetical protein COV52_05100 [Gammaproteobacteria bacterium CG11_big_fil_rev_8_21_14_0_20_46_22]|nr:MAG: hypothetical protein COW05_10155 [Gammaproteobacteria bacterium CG12_big_fil_rev_8_21_14_0_65_46_12]PIR11173.1 MAG: hypothetical protein COV52_05100 [Gammaproteobacteria bacterium CG11_big_fil_rev_8_21_14_0_20_46_22]